MIERAGINAIFWDAQSGGVGRYVDELVPALLEARPGLELTVFATRDAPRPDWVGEVRWETAPGTGSAARLWAQWGWIARAAARRRLEVVHGLANVGPLVTRGAARVITFHDLTWLRHPETMDRFSRIAMRATALPSLRRADRVITGSQASAADLVATLGVDPGRLDVVPHGVRSRSIAPSEDVRARLAIGPGPLMLAVAQKRPHKNLTALVRALAVLPDMRLVLPGAPTPHEAQLRALAGQLGVADRLHLPAWVSEPDLEGLYAEAAVFVLPSFEEGFGLPVLEAMARGVPVACSDIPVLREVGGDAATYFDPHDATDVVRAVREADGSGGRERAAQFTWRRAAEGTLEAYERAVAS